MMYQRLFPLFSFLIFVSSMIGCSNHVGLSGRVIYEDNGEPVPQGEVQLTTPTFVSRATIQADGTFDASTFEEGDGLPPGTYNVAIVSIDVEGNPLIDPKLSDAKTSGLTQTVDETTRSIEFKVGRPPAVPKMAPPPLR